MVKTRAADDLVFRIFHYIKLPFTVFFHFSTFLFQCQLPFEATCTKIGKNKTYFIKPWEKTAEKAIEILFKIYYNKQNKQIIAS